LQHVDIQNRQQHLLAMSSPTSATHVAAAAISNAATTTIAATRASLTRALEANEAVEKAILQELQKLASQKAENRKKAAHLTHSLNSTLSSSTTDDDNKEPRKQEQQSSPLDTKKKALEYVYRPWHRVFFSDGKSIPEPNADTVRRQTVANNTLFYHTNPPWLAKESKVLLDLVVVQQKQQKQQQQKLKSRRRQATTTTKIDFEQVARELQQRANQARGNNASFPSATAKPRSALECEVEFNRQVHDKNNKKGSKKKNAMLSSSEMISKAISSVTPTSAAAAAAAAPSTRQGVDWQAVAVWLHEHEKIQTSAWECFAEHQKARRRRKQNENGITEPWTVQQDEVLLKYVAAMGPQALVDGHGMNHLLIRLLPNKTKSQILNRINHSLLNPTLRHDAWSGDEERLLTVCMKMYSDTTTNNNDAAADPKIIEKQALYLAGTHLPHRATASVLHKWHRTLNPDYDTGPFTKAEDAKLLQVLRTSTETTATPHQLGWKELAQRHFPNRHSHRLMNRWSEIASNDDIIARFGKDYFQKKKHHHPDDKNEDSNNDTKNKRKSKDDAQGIVVPTKKKQK
jgi:Myb-like DNA-binding domain